MASPRSHILKAQHNEGLLRPLETLDSHPDWYITAAFYAGVHWIRAFLALHQIGQGDAEQVTYEEFPRHLRTIGFQTKVPVEPLIQNFMDLKTLSQQARYRCRPKHWYDQRLHEADAALQVVRAFVQANGIVP